MFLADSVLTCSVLCIVIIFKTPDIGWIPWS